jgi:cytochrome c peroxidase
VHAPAPAAFLPLLVLPLVYACGGDNADAASVLATPLGLEIVNLNVPADNPLSAAKAELGKTLFFDTRLSSDGMMSCQTCHQHAMGWTDGLPFSTKVGGAVNTRNSPTLYNVGYQSLYYWDGRAESMEANVGAAWKGHMGGEDQDAVAQTLGEIPGYATMFQEAFSEAPTGENIVKALTTFVRTLRSGDSAWDRGEASADAKAGYDLFMDQEKAGCAQCHTLPLFTDMAFHNVGVGMGSGDLGRGKDGLDPTKPGAFKTPTLRSVTKTGPYFHDASVATLDEAVRFMVAGGGADNPNRDELLKPADLTEEEILQLIAFIESLESTESFTPPTIPQN